MILLNINNALTFLGPEYGLLPRIVLIIGLAKIIDLGTGLNSQILLSSKFWRVDFVTNMCFVLFSIVLNIMLVKRYNLIGSAFATVISYFIYNLTRFIFIWRLFKLQPYSWANAKALAIAAVSTLAIWKLPQVSNVFIDAAVRGLLFILIYGAGVLYFHISEDITSLYHHTIQRVREVFKTK